MAYSFSYSAILCTLTLHQLFRDHIPADGAVVLMEAEQDLIDLRFFVNAPRFKGLHHLLQTDALLLPLGRNGFQLSVLKKAVDDFPAVFLIPPRLLVLPVRGRPDQFQNAPRKISRLMEYMV